MMQQPEPGQLVTSAEESIDLWKEHKEFKGVHFRTGRLTYDRVAIVICVREEEVLIMCGTLLGWAWMARLHRLDGRP